MIGNGETEEFPFLQHWYNGITSAFQAEVASSILACCSILEKCKFCGKKFSIKGIGSHTWRMHGDGIGFKPTEGSVPWNKGLNEKTDSRIKKGNDKLRDSYKIGKNKPSMLGKSLSIESRKKLSETCLSLNYRRVSSKSFKYVCLDGRIFFLDSSWELILAQLLDKMKIYWTRPKPIKWRDPEGKIRNYFPDFYLPEYNLYLDPKNKFLQVRDLQKIESVRCQNNISLILLNKEQINEEYIRNLL